MVNQAKLTCWKCGWQMVRIQVRSGTCQLCPCGAPQAQPQRQQSYRANGSNGGNGGGGGGSRGVRSQQQRPPMQQQQQRSSPHQQQQQLPPQGPRGRFRRPNMWLSRKQARAQHNTAAAQPPRQSEEAPATELSNDGTSRSQQSMLISKYQKILADLGAEADQQLKQSIQLKIDAAKSSIINAKPLDQQVSALEAYLDRKSTKALELQRSIIDAHAQLLIINEDISVKRASLAQLKEKQVAAISGVDAPLAAPASDSQQLSVICSTLQNLLTGLEALPAEAQTAARQLLLPLTSVCPTLAPPSVGVAAAVSPISAAVPPPPSKAAEVELEDDDMSAFGPQCDSAAKRARNSANPYPASSKDMAAELALNSESVEAIMARLPTPARTDNSAPSSPPFGGTEPGAHPG